MTTIERVEPQTEREIAVAIVDTDVHPMPVSTDVLKSYAPAEWVDKIWPTGNAVTPVPHFYDTPDSYKTMSMRVDAAPPGGGFAGTDPDYAAKQLLIDAGRQHRHAGTDVRCAAAAGRTRAEVDLQRLARRRLAGPQQRARSLAWIDQRQRAGARVGGARG